MVYRSIKFIWKQEKSGVNDVEFAEEKVKAVNSCLEDIESDLSYDYHFVTRKFLKKNSRISFIPLSSDYIKVIVEFDLNL